MLIILVVLAVIAVGGFFLVSNFTNNNNNTTEKNTQTTESNLPTGSENTSPTSAEEVGQTFNIESNNFSFSVKEIKVKQGEKVTVILKNSEGFHDFVLDEFNVKTEVLQTGKSETVSFTADKKGTYEYYCSVGNHRAQGMVGKLIVE